MGSVANDPWRSSGLRYSKRQMHFLIERVFESVTSFRFFFEGEDTLQKEVEILEFTAFIPKKDGKEASGSKNPGEGGMQAVKRRNLLEMLLDFFFFFPLV
ncbi:hypothetical protein JTE90_026272 [Oedothorax gibbosus]|uniref:Uncharacterized protein n=1 Tax=Oedothorax gibbosus TaxID=931172 RepID=A0AAV6U425_9ARAC|nr:hypothetical protein JTE90_026272 [Oedothorax gibbosus]